MSSIGLRPGLCHGHALDGIMLGTWPSKNCLVVVAKSAGCIILKIPACHFSKKGLCLFWKLHDHLAYGYRGNDFGLGRDKDRFGHTFCTEAKVDMVKFVCLDLNLHWYILPLCPPGKHFPSGMQVKVLAVHKEFSAPFLRIPFFVFPGKAYMLFHQSWS